MTYNGWYAIKPNQTKSHLNGFRYSKWVNSSICSLYGTLIGTTNPGQSGSGSNSSEWVLRIIPDSRAETFPSDAV